VQLPTDIALNEIDPYAESGGDYMKSLSSGGYIQQTAAANATVNPITGTIGKAFDTFLDAFALAGANKIVGTNYPTGQQNPQAVASANLAAANQAPFNWKPYAIGGGILVGVVLLAAIIKRR